MANYTINQALQLAITKQQKGDFNSAKNIYQKIIHADPENVVSLVNLSEIARLYGKYSNSIKMLTRALKFSPKNVGVLNGLGQVYLDMEEYDKAEASFIEASKIKDGYGSPYLNLGNLYQIKGDYDKSIKAYIKALEYKENPYSVYNNIAGIYYLKKQYQQAIIYYQKAIDINPTVNAYTNISETYLKMQNLEQALSYIDKSIELAGGFNIRALSFKSVCLYELGRKNEAAKIGCLQSDVVVSRAVPDKYFSGDLVEFNKQLSLHLSVHPSLKADPYKNATKNGWHTKGNLAEEDNPVMNQMKDIINKAVRSRVDNLTNDPKHPLRFNLPKDYYIYIWSVKMGKQGHQEPHIHESGWLSGVYYCQIPKEIQSCEDSIDGWIEFGKCRDDIPCEKEHPLRLIKPEEGVIATFPSHFWHRTIPFESDQYRICVAFDVIPKQEN